MRRVIAVIIANDAVPTTQPYERVGPMSAQRIRDACRWFWSCHALDSRRIVWACGAGVKDVALPGPTLAQLTEMKLRSWVPDVIMLTNIDERHIWGSAEEIRWVVRRAQEEFPDDALEFVFFTAAAHMPRVKFTVRVLFPEVCARFVTTTESLELSRRAELLKCMKVLWLWWKWTFFDLLAAYGELKLKEQGVKTDRG
jgi:hypothetical protein